VSWLEEVERALAAAPIRRLAAPPQQRAAVLVPLFVHQGTLWTLLTRRSPGLPRPAGAIVFPGGLARAGDEDEVATALRETEEELGIPQEEVAVLGQLSDVTSAAGPVISPVVGAIPWPVTLRVAAREVAELLPTPLVALFQPTLVERVEEEGPGGLVTSPVLHYGPRRIAGATAQVLLELLARLSGGLADGAAGPPIA